VSGSARGDARGSARGGVGGAVERLWADSAIWCSGGLRSVHEGSAGWHVGELWGHPRQAWMRRQPWWVSFEASASVAMEATARSGGWWLHFLARRMVGGGSGATRMEEAAWHGLVWRRQKRQRKRERMDSVVFLEQSTLSYLRNILFSGISPLPSASTKRGEVEPSRSVPLNS
jgi:hypothetical protein